MSFKLPILFNPYFPYATALDRSRASGFISTGDDGILCLEPEMFPASMLIQYTVRYASNPYTGYAFTWENLVFPFDHAYPATQLSVAAPLISALPNGSQYILPLANVITGSSGGYTIRGSLTSLSLLHRVGGDNFYHPVTDPDSTLETFTVSDGPRADGAWSYKGSGTAVTKCRILFTGAVPPGTSSYSAQGGAIAYLDKIPRAEDWGSFSGRAAVTKHWELLFTVQIWTEYSILCQSSFNGGNWSAGTTKTGTRYCTPVMVRYVKSSFASSADFSPYGSYGFLSEVPSGGGTSIMFIRAASDLASVVAV